MLFTRKNYILIAVSVVLILLGLVLMSGGGTQPGQPFSMALFAPRRIVVAPMVCLAGFLLMIYAIMAKPKGVEKEKKEE